MASEWKGEVNTDRTHFKEFMQEIRKKIDQIFDRLPLTVSVGQSPIRLTDLGKVISKELDAPTWAGRLAIIVEDRVKGKEAYDIQEYCFEYVNEHLQYSLDPP